MTFMIGLLLFYDRSEGLSAAFADLTLTKMTADWKIIFFSTSSFTMGQQLLLCKCGRSYANVLVMLMTILNDQLQLNFCKWTFEFWQQHCVYRVQTLISTDQENPVFDDMALLKCPQGGKKWELGVLFTWKNKHLWEAGFIKVFDPTSTARLFIWKDLTHLLCRLLCGQRSICSCMLQMACARGPLMETSPQQSMYPTHQAKWTIIYAKKMVQGSRLNQYINYPEGLLWSCWSGQAV